MNNFKLRPPVTDLLLIDIETVLIPEFMIHYLITGNRSGLTRFRPKTFLFESYLQKAGILRSLAKVICISFLVISVIMKKGIDITAQNYFRPRRKELLSGFSELTDRFYKHNNNFQFESQHPGI